MRDISRTAEDHLKAIWSATEWDGAPITVKGLAERFGTTAASASDTVKRLVGQGLVVHEPYRSIELSVEGERQAIAVVRRHRLIETFLVERLGYGWDEVHDEAESIEHAASDLLIDRIEDLLGHPTADPHGDPIPTRAGAVHYPAGARRLDRAAPGEYRVTRISDDDSDQLAAFAASGLVTGAAITVAGQTAHRTDVTLADETITLAHAAASAVIVVAA